MRLHLKTKPAILRLVCLALCWGTGPTQLLAIDSGAAIYQQGATQSGKAYLGSPGNTAPASLFPCINCHGDRAAGAKETSVVAPDITWSQLRQAYRKDLDGGRPRAAYDRQSFKTALLDGINSDGGYLSDRMPRYALSDTEIASLIEYLNHITQQTRRGITGNAIHFWLRLPENPELAAAIFQTVTAFVSRTNDQGGIYRRKLMLHDLSPSEAAESAFSVIDLRMLRVQKTVYDQVSLGIFAAQGAGEKAYFLYQHPADLNHQAIAIAKQHGWTPMIIDQADTEPAIAKLNQLKPMQTGATALLHLATIIPINRLIPALTKAQRYPILLTDSLALSTAEQELISHYPAPVYILNPPGAESVTLEGQRDFSQLASSASFSQQHLSARLWSLALMRLLVTALEQSGKDLTQDGFNQTLQHQVDLETGFGPALTYSSIRRVGYSGAILVPIN